MINKNNSKKKLNNSIKYKSIKCNRLYKIIKNTMLGKGISGIVYKGKNNESNDNIGIKIVTLKKKYKLNNKHPGYIDALIGIKITELNIPHVNKVYKNIDCKLSDISKIDFINKDWLNEKKKLLKDGVIYNKIKVIINELCDSDLYKYLKENQLSKKQHLILLFYFCYTITCIQYHIKNYRHNDIKPNNILVKLKETKVNANDYDLYIIFNKKYYLPCLQFTIKLHDFDFSNSDKYPNQKILNYKNTIQKRTGCTPEINPTYDLHEYINFILIFSKNYLNYDIIEFYSKLIPENTIGLNNTYTFKGKLTKFHHNEKIEESNYIPPDMNTPAEHFFLETFEQFTKEPNQPYNIVNIYESTIQNKDSVLNRTDMFNPHKI